MTPLTNRTKTLAVNYLAAATLLPLRLLLTTVNLTMAAAIGQCAILGHDMEYPITTPWRKQLISCLRYQMRFQLFIFGYYHVKTVGAPAPKEVAPILVGNHITFVDGLVLASQCLPMALSAVDHLSMPLWPPILRAAQCIFVDRTLASNAGVVRDIARRTRDPRYPRMVIFPEGTCGNGQGLLQFKRGAFASRQPVQPFVLRYPFQTFDPCWVSDGPSLGVILFRMMTQWSNSVEIEYLPVQSADETEDVAHFADRVQRLIADTLRVPITDYTFEDVRLGSLADRHGYPPAHLFVGMAALRRQFPDSSIDFATVQGCATAFLYQDTDKDGRISSEAMIGLAGALLPLQVQVQVPLARMFTFGEALTFIVSKLSAHRSDS
jgi:lysophosphatidylcholine acyltransferase/lyso-PAF acetyltransferase